MPFPTLSGEHDIFVHEFTMPDGKTCLGFSGPMSMCWSFRSQLDSFTLEEQIWIYAGWYATFVGKKGLVPCSAPTPEENARAVEAAADFGYPDTFAHSKVNLEGKLFYSMWTENKEVNPSPKYLVFELTNLEGGYNAFEPELWFGHEADALFYLIGKSFFSDGVGGATPPSSQ